jgi:hypothetical protein
MTLEWYGSDVSLTLDGVRYDGPQSIEYREEPEYGFDVSSLIRKPSVTASVEFTMPGALEAFAGLFKREPVGASMETLVRRVRYGGRKGRSAMRRLFARALPIEMTSGISRFRGKAVFLEDGEIQVRARSVPWDSFEQLVERADREMAKLLLPASYTVPNEGEDQR